MFQDQPGARELRAWGLRLLEAGRAWGLTLPTIPPRAAQAGKPLQELTLRKGKGPGAFGHLGTELPPSPSCPTIACHSRALGPHPWLSW